MSCTRFYVESTQAHSISCNIGAQKRTGKKFLLFKKPIAIRVQKISKLMRVSEKVLTPPHPKNIWAYNVVWKIK